MPPNDTAHTTTVYSSTIGHFTISYLHAHSASPLNNSHFLICQSTLLPLWRSAVFQPSPPLYLTLVSLVINTLLEHKRWLASKGEYQGCSRCGAQFLEELAVRCGAVRDFWKYLRCGAIFFRTANISGEHNKNIIFFLKTAFFFPLFHRFSPNAYGVYPFFNFCLPSFSPRNSHFSFFPANFRIFTIFF